jgi:hypothetical protein
MSESRYRSEQQLQSMKASFKVPPILSIIKAHIVNSLGLQPNRSNSGGLNIRTDLSVGNSGGISLRHGSS